MDGRSTATMSLAKYNGVIRLKDMADYSSLVTNFGRLASLTRGTYFVTFAHQSPRLGLPG